MALTDVLQYALPAAGTLVGGPVGGAIGAFAGGLAGQVDANKKQKAYQKAENAIPLVDPMQQAYMARVQQQERNMRAGTDVSSALSQRLLNNNVAQTQMNLMRLNGPNAANNILRSQAAAAGQGAQIGANAGRNADQLLSYQGGLIDNIANRVYMRQRQRRDQALQDYKTAQQDTNARLGGAVGALPQIGIKKSYPYTPPLAQNAVPFGTTSYAPPAGIQYGGFPQQQNPINYGFGYNQQPQVNYGFNGGT